MSVRYKGNDNIAGSAGLLLFILARYPEVAAINFDPATRALKFTFISSRVLGPEEVTIIKRKVLDSIEVFNLLEKRKAKISAFYCLDCEELNIIEIQRDIDTLTSEEISLFAQLMRDFLGSNLIYETSEAYFEDDLIFQEEIIEHLLESLKGDTENKRLFAFREENRLLVFNK